MNQFETLSRRIRIIRLVDKPFRYPSKEVIVEALKATGLKSVSVRSIERDIKEIKNEYSIYIKLNRQKRGYYLDRPIDEDPADFEQMLQILERREKIKFLSEAVADLPHASRFVQLEQAPSVAGTEHLPRLLDAIRLERCVQFSYQKFEDPTAVSTRLVEVQRLFEYRNRWYLDSFDLHSNGPRTYGLDRISDVKLSTQLISRQSRPDIDRHHVIGVTAPEGAQPERVVLRFIASEANYPRTLPLHPSQQMVEATPDFVDYELTVVINHELMREILAFGDFVEVLEPLWLREKIKRRIDCMQQRYTDSMRL